MGLFNASQNAFGRPPMPSAPINFVPPPQIMASGLPTLNSVTNAVDNSGAAAAGGLPQPEKKQSGGLMDSIMKMFGGASGPAGTEAPAAAGGGAAAGAGDVMGNIDLKQIAMLMGGF